MIWQCVYKTHSRSFNSTFSSLFRKMKLDCRFIKSRRRYRAAFTRNCTQNCKNCYFLPRHNCHLRVNLPFHVCFWSCYPVSLHPSLAVVFGDSGIIASSFCICLPVFLISDSVPAYCTCFLGGSGEVNKLSDFTWNSNFKFLGFLRQSRLGRPLTFVPLQNSTLLWGNNR